MVKIQLALDTLVAEDALRLASLAAPYVDILEAGTPLIKSAGIGIVTRLKNAHPDKVILADMKTSDVGAYEAGMAFKAGADIVTTQGITTTATISEVQREADKWNRRAEVDMTGVKDPVARSKEIKAVGVNYILYHRSIDEEMTVGASWNSQTAQTVRELCGLGMDIAIAGGINAEILSMLKGIPLYSIVAGRGITAQQNPEEAARALSQRIREIWPG